MGAAPDVVDLAAAYLGLLFLFFPVTAALSVLAAVFHGAGNTRVPLIAYAGANLLHVALAILIYGVGTVEPMGVRGAALAVVVSTARPSRSSSSWLSREGSSGGAADREE